MTGLGLVQPLQKPKKNHVLRTDLVAKSQYLPVHSSSSKDRSLFARNITLKNHQLF